MKFHFLKSKFRFIYQSLKFSILSIFYQQRFQYIRCIRLSEELKLYVIKVVDWKNSRTFYLARMSRYPRYTRGLEFMQDSLLKSYCLSLTEVQYFRNIIDVGTQEGIFFSAVQRHVPQCRVLGIELEKAEYLCSHLNSDGKTTLIVNAGAWNEDGVAQFESLANSGDSSLIHHRMSNDFRWIQTLKIDSLATDYFGLNVIDCIKLDAEGAEVEVLMGARNTLLRTRFVSVDVGPERGPNQESTKDEVNVFLKSMGFNAVRWGSIRDTVLFKNVNLD